MAWSCFSRIPCPYRGWDEKSRYAMLNMFPIVGIVLGIITCAACAAMNLVGAGQPLSGVVVTALYFWMTGFIHIDGFMDCCDAVLSRRGFEERQRILKDSYVGAFAVVSFVFMAMIFVASMGVITENFSVGYAAEVCVFFTVSRELSGYAVINIKAMKTSQYSGLSSHSSNERGVPGVIITVCISLVMVFCFCSGFAGGNGFSWYRIAVYAVVALMSASIQTIAGRRMRAVLGGMSGDVSGYMIVTGELSGVLILALLISGGLI